MRRSSEHLMAVTDWLFGLVFIFSVGTAHGMHGRDQIREANCGNTVTTSIEACPVLLQSTSSRSRFDRSRWADESADIKNQPNIGGISSEEAAFLSISSSSLTLSAFTHLRSWRLSGITYVLAHSNSVVFILAVVMLLTIASVVVWLLQPHPFMKGGGAESALRSTESLGQAKNEPLCYSRSSPPIPPKSQVTTRSTAATPQASGYSGKAAESLAGGMRGVTSSEECDTQEYSSPHSLDSPDMQFCPELVVPPGSECILTLPWQERSYSRFAVSDAKGNAVLNVQSSVVGDLWTATVATEARDVLAMCREIRSFDAPVFELMPAAGAPCWAKLVYSPEGERFLLSPNRGPVWHFWGNFENLAVNITDETNRLFATTELQSVEHDPTGRKHCRLRVAPKADVGMALLGMLCVGRHLATQPKLNRR